MDDKNHIDKYPLYHTGLIGCGEVAFYSRMQLVEMVDPIPAAADIILLDGSVPNDWDVMICGNCKRPVDWSELSSTRKS